MTREENEKIARILNWPVKWDHSEILLMIRTPESRKSNDGRGIYVRCEGCNINGYGNEIEPDLLGFCRKPKIPDFSSEDRIILQIIDANELQITHIGGVTCCSSGGSDGSGSFVGEAVCKWILTRKVKYWRCQSWF